MRFIHEQTDWPAFRWQADEVLPTLADVRHRHGCLLGRMQSLGFDLQAEASLRILTSDVLQTSAIEGHQLDADDVRSSIARRLGLPEGASVAPTATSKASWRSNSTQRRTPPRRSFR